MNWLNRAMENYPVNGHGPTKTIKQRAQEIEDNLTRRGLGQ